MFRRCGMAIACALLLASPVIAAQTVDELKAVADQKFYRVTLKDVEEAVARALVSEGAGEHLSALMIGRRGTPLYAHDSAIEVEVKTLEFDEKAKTWSANLLFRSEGDVLTAMPARGRYEEVAQVPVLKERVKQGEVVTQEMISWVDMPASRMRAGVITDDSEIVGKTARRVISPDRPIRQEELQSPSVVKKGSKVTLLFSQGGIEIKTLGEALEAGAVGDSIRVKNIESKQVVAGVIASSDTVTVTSLAHRKP